MNVTGHTTGHMLPIKEKTKQSLLVLTLFQKVKKNKKKNNLQQQKTWDGV